MRAALSLVLLVASCAFAGPRAAQALVEKGSAFAMPLMEDDRLPTLVLAQRVIARDWGASDESTYVEVSVPDWKSEGWAMALSGVVPGAGHAYLGENSGLLFALVEIGGWMARLHFDQKDEELRQEASVFRGNPEDSSAAWSFDRWEQTTGGDAAGIRALYEHDPAEFDVRIGRDPAYATGWAADPTQDQFVNYLDRADGMLERKRYATTGIWVNHLAAAFDAMRAARIHNIPLRQDLRIRVKTSWRHGSPAIRASLERKF
jgi:hypothetical protein